MNLQVNGREVELSEGATLATLIETMALQSKRIAIEVNEELIRRTDFPTHALHAGDRIEVVQAIGGG